MRNFKRKLAGFLAVAMALTAAPVDVFANVVQRNFNASQIRWVVGTSQAPANVAFGHYGHAAIDGSAVTAHPGLPSGITQVRRGPQLRFELPLTTVQHMVNNPDAPNPVIPFSITNGEFLYQVPTLFGNDLRWYSAGQTPPSWGNAAGTTLPGRLEGPGFYIWVSNSHTATLTITDVTALSSSHNFGAPTNVTLDLTALTRAQFDANRTAITNAIVSAPEDSSLIHSGAAIVASGTPPLTIPNPAPGQPGHLPAQPPLTIPNPDPGQPGHVPGVPPVNRALPAGYSVLFVLDRSTPSGNFSATYDSNDYPYAVITAYAPGTAFENTNQILAQIPIANPVSGEHGHVPGVPAQGWVMPNPGVGQPHHLLGVPPETISNPGVGQPGHQPALPGATPPTTIPNPAPGQPGHVSAPGVAVAENTPISNLTLLQLNDNAVWNRLWDQLQAASNATPPVLANISVLIPGAAGTVNMPTGAIDVFFPLLFRTTSNENTTLTINSALASNVNVAALTNAVLSQRTAAGISHLTRSSAAETHRFNLNFDIRILENGIGQFPGPAAGSTGAHSAFELVAPSGFSWATGVNPTVSLSPGLATHGATIGSVTRPDGTNNTVLRFYFDNLHGTTTPGSIYVTGLSLIGNAHEDTRLGDVYVQYRNVANRANVVVPGSFNAGTIADYGITMTVLGENVPELISGRLLGQAHNDISITEHRAATVRVYETVLESAHAARTLTFSLPEGVRIREVTFENINYLNTATSNALHRNSGNRFFNTNQITNSHVRVNNNEVSLINLGRQLDGTVAAGRLGFDMTLYLTVEPGFEGNIDLTVGGTAARDLTSTPNATVATAISPITVNADVSNVRVGYHFVPVGNFSITENVAGALMGGHEAFVSIHDYFFPNVRIAPGFNWSVTEGNLDINNVRTGANFAQAANQWADIIFNVNQASSTPSTIEFSNVRVELTTTAPVTDAAFDLVVWGPAVANNFNSVAAVQGNFTAANDPRTQYQPVNTRNLFNTAGFNTPFITIGTEGASIVNQPVTFSEDGVVTVGGTVQNFPAEQWGSFEINESGVSVLPARMAFAVLFGGNYDPYDTQMFVWNAAESMFLIDQQGRDIRFQVNNQAMWVDGVQRTILSGEGAAAFPYAPYVNPANQRMMLPVRAFADALGLTVSWDAATSTVTLTPPGYVAE